MLLEILNPGTKPQLLALDPPFLTDPSIYFLARIDNESTSHCSSDGSPHFAICSLQCRLVSFPYSSACTCVICELRAHRKWTIAFMQSFWWTCVCNSYWRNLRGAKTGQVVSFSVIEVPDKPLCPICVNITFRMTATRHKMDYTISPGPKYMRIRSSQLQEMARYCYGISC